MICDIITSVKRRWTGAFRSAVLVIGLLLVGSCAWAQETIVYYHTDGVGSVRVVTDSGGNLLHHRDYLPFGEPWPSAPPFERRGFAGMEKDAETTLNYVGARHYTSLSGRFTTVDPLLDLARSPEDPQSWNRYAYVRNNPLRHVDPDGRQGVPVTWYQRILAGSPLLQRLSNHPIVQQVETLSFTVGLKLADFLGRPSTQELLKTGVEVATGTDAGPVGLLPAFSASTIESAVLSAAETSGKQASIALRNLASHIDRGQAAFQGLDKTQEVALGLIQAILKNPNRVSAGKKTVDVYDRLGRGVRIEITTGRFIGYLDEAEATR